VKITKLVKARDEERVNVFVDGKYFTNLSLDTVAQLGLYVDKDINGIDFETVKLGDWEKRLVAECINYFSLRPRSVRETKDYLQKKLVKISRRVEDVADKSEEIKTNVIAYLQEKKYLSDKEFATWWISNRKLNTNRSKLKLKQELMQKGVERSVIEELLSKQYGKEDEEEAIEADAAKKQKQLILKKLPPKVARQKLIQYLQGKGYGWDLISQTVRIN
jgi:regulatory protein